MPGLFTNSWTNAGNVAYRKEGSQVQIRGTLGAGTANASAFSLPAGFSPPINLSFIVNGATATSAAAVNVLSSGAVTPQTSQATNLIGILFAVD